jgi:hypothetical protein
VGRSSVPKADRIPVKDAALCNLVISDVVAWFVLVGLVAIGETVGITRVTVGLAVVVVSVVFVNVTIAATTDARGTGFVGSVCVLSVVFASGVEFEARVREAAEFVDSVAVGKRVSGCVL